LAGVVTDFWLFFRLGYTWKSVLLGTLAFVAVWAMAAFVIGIIMIGALAIRRRAYLKGIKAS